MKKAVLLVGLIFFLMIGCGGCASILTNKGPLKSELIDGETRPGNFSSYDYSYHTASNYIYLERIPMCREVREKIRVMQKRPRGLYFMLLELPIFGLGFVDMVHANAIAERSRREIPLAEYETGGEIQCGEPKPGANETLIIYNKREDIEITAVTDQYGAINLNEILHDVPRIITLRTHLASQPEFSFFHRYLPGLR